MIFLYDITSLEWSHRDTEQKNVFFIGFTDGDKDLVEFDNLSYGIKVLSGSETILDKAYPKEDETIIYTDQEWIKAVEVILTPSTEYSISVWAENGGIKNEYEYIFTSPVAQTIDSPFPSWTWDEENKAWQPPTQKPIDGYWTWDEDNLSWVEM
jgi:hypothetical protein